MLLLFVSAAVVCMSLWFVCYCWLYVVVGVVIVVVVVVVDCMLLLFVC